MCGQGQGPFSVDLVSNFGCYDVYSLFAIVFVVLLVLVLLLDVIVLLLLPLLAQVNFAFMVPTS